jgi:hypothetical protein
MTYVWILWFRKEKYINPFLQGRRLKIAAFLPMIWLTYVFSDAYEVWMICTREGWENINQASLTWKAARQCISMVGSVITALLLIGHDLFE